MVEESPDDRSPESATFEADVSDRDADEEPRDSATTDDREDETGPDAPVIGADVSTEGDTAEADTSDASAETAADTETAAASTDTDTVEAETADAEAETADTAGGGATTESEETASKTTSGLATPTTPPDPDSLGPTGVAEPPDDEEMPLTEHIEEMIQRLAVVGLAAAVATALGLPFAEDVILHVWYDILPGSLQSVEPIPYEVQRLGFESVDQASKPRVYGPLEKKLTELKVAALAGTVVALPVLVYESYAFMRPGLYPHERRYYLAAVPTSLVLALIGVAFSYFLVLPGLFTYFLYYSEASAEIAFALGRTFDLIVIMLGFMAIVFQIPLFMMLAIMMGVTSREWMTNRRLYFWGAFLTIAFIFSPDPTGMAPIVIALTMVGLFEGTLLLLRWTGN